MRFFVVTYGCQMNERDSEAVGALLAARGHVPAEGEADADVILVNTCSVRGKAEDKAIGKLRLMVDARRRGARRLVGVMGCMAQRLGPAAFEAVPGLDFAIGTRRLAQVAEVLERVQATGGPVLETGESPDDLAALAGHAPGAMSAFVNILFGCDRRCAYCVVPAVRGREWSRPAADVIEEVRRVAADGAREVTLLGQSVTSYGLRNAVWPDGHVSRLGFEEPLPRLLEALDGIPGLARVRFTSSHPSGCTTELARAMGALRAVCGHIHLPCQSGSDRILKLMRRGYTTADYRRAVDRLRRAVPGLAVSTDVIVGFPTETGEDFEETSRFMDAIGFDQAFVFKYSPRPGTPAAQWEDDVPADEKQRRNKRLLAEQDQRCLAGNCAAVGRTEQVLVEGVSLRNAARWAGRTTSNRIAVFEPVEGMKPGDLAWVRIESARPQTLYGRVVEAPVV